MSEKKPIEIKTAGTYRVRSGEAMPIRIEPRDVPAPTARTPMSPAHAERIRGLRRKSR